MSATPNAPDPMLSISPPLLTRDYDFFVEGQSIVLNFFEKDGKLLGAPTGQSVEELYPVQGSPLKFEVRPSGSDQIFQLEFMRNDKGEIDRCHVISPEFETTGQKIKKAA